MRSPTLLSALALASASLSAAETAKPAAALYDSNAKGDAKASPAGADTYELRGFFGAGENLEVSVRPSGTEVSRWLKVGRKSGDLLIEKADPKAGTATLVAGGRRQTLRLAGEAPPAAVEASKDEAAPELSEADKARKARRERFRQMRENSTPEQQAEFQRVMMEKMDAYRKEHPDAMNRENFNDPAKRKAMGEVFRATMLEAATAAAKLPGKDGKISPVPEDFNTLLIEEGKDMEARGGRFGGRGRGPRGGDEAPAEKPPAKTTEPAAEPQKAGDK